MADPAPAILTRRLSKSFGQRTILDGIDLEVPLGESVVLTGANGAGKTTLLRCLAAVLRPTSGEVRWFGRDAAGDHGARRLLGMVAHESGVYPHLTLRENLVFAARMCDVARPGERAEQMLAEVGLRLHAERLPPVLSRGMRQRLALARALVHDPPLLLLDEPFAGLDAEGADWLLRLFADLQARGRTLFFVLHDEEKTRQLADRVLELRQGQVCQRAVEEDDGREGTGFARAA